MTEYTITLALEDFIPVIFSSIGLFFIGRLVATQDGRLKQMAIIGWILVTLGGLFKATWKLIMAITQTRVDIIWMDKGMFLWMAVGFTLLAAALWHFDQSAETEKSTSQLWLVPGLIIGLSFIAILFTGFPDFAISTWRFILLGVMTLANVFMTVLLIRLANQQQQRTAALLFLGSIIIVFILSGMARIPEQTIPLQWTEQLLNTAAQGAFAFAVWIIYQKDKQYRQHQTAVA